MFGDAPILKLKWAYLSLVDVRKQIDEFGFKSGFYHLINIIKVAAQFSRNKASNKYGH